MPFAYHAHYNTLWGWVKDTLIKRGYYDKIILDTGWFVAAFLPTLLFKGQE